jgi:hypothetical protein
MELTIGGLDSPEKWWEFPIDDFLVLARQDHPALYILNPSARLIWDISRTGAPFSELVRTFAWTYGIPTELAARDVRRTLDHWASSLLARGSNSPRRAVASEVPACPAAVAFTGDYLIQGKNVRVILHTSELAEEILPRLHCVPRALSAPDLTFKVVGDSEGYRIFCGERLVAHEEGVGAARSVLFQEIVRSCRGRDCLAVFHAGACGSNSRCVVFPAVTQSGKTTLAAVLMKMGLTFYSDDSVLLERDALSVPVMPFALMVREGSWDVLTPRFPELQDVPIVSRYNQRIRFLPPTGIRKNDHCERVGAIVFVRFAPGVAGELNTLDPLQTLLRLQESGFWVAHDQRSIRAFLAWVQSTPSFTLNYSDVDDAASIIRELVLGGSES